MSGKSISRLVSTIFFITSLLSERIFLLPFMVIGMVFGLAYLVTEFVLNTLYTVLVDPVIFAFESIQQLLTTEEFAYTPTEDTGK